MPSFHRVSLALPVLKRPLKTLRYDFSALTGRQGGKNGSIRVLRHELRAAIDTQKMAPTRMIAGKPVFYR